MKSRFEGKTVEDAIKKAETQLGMSREHFTVDVINEDTKGFLGIGAKDAVIEVIYEEVSESHCGCHDHEHGDGHNHEEHENHEHHEDNHVSADEEHIKILKNFLDEFLRLFEVKASYEINESDAVSYTHLDVYKRQALISTSSPFDVKLISPDGTFLTMSERSLLEKQQVPSSTTVHGHSLMIVNSVSVSYTHLDVYKRQEFHLA